MAPSNCLVRATTRLAQGWPRAGWTQRDGIDGPGWRCGTVHAGRVPLGTVTVFAGTRCLLGVSNVRAGQSWRLHKILILTAPCGGPRIPINCETSLTQERALCRDTTTASHCPVSDSPSSRGHKRTTSRNTCLPTCGRGWLNTINASLIVYRRSAGGRSGKGTNHDLWSALELAAKLGKRANERRLSSPRNATWGWDMISATGSSANLRPTVPPAFPLFVASTAHLVIKHSGAGAQET